MTEIDAIRNKIRKLDGEEFVSSVTSICSDLQKNLNILAFGFIVYDETTPEFRKILRDTDYWEALDRASGDKMMILALSDKVDTESEGIGTIRFLTSFSASRPSRTKSYSHLLKELFSDESLLVYPSVLFFQVHSGNIYNYRLVPLKRCDVWESLNSVQTLFNSISQVLNRITPENYQNHGEIFELIKKELLQQKYTMYILNGPKLLADFFGRVKNLLFFL